MHSVTALPIISLLSLLTPIQARISGISLPTTITPNTNIVITLITEDYIQSVQDVAVAFGIASAEGAHDRELGTFWAGQSKMIGPDQSNILTNITEYVEVPAGTPAGPSVVTAELFSLYGAGYEGVVTNFTFDVTVASA